MFFLRMAFVAVAAVLWLAPAMAAARCVELGEARPLVQSGAIVPLMSAIGAARHAAKGEMIDGSLCGAAGNYRYVVTFLGPDGHVSRVTIDARSGGVLSVK